MSSFVRLGWFAIFLLACACTPGYAGQKEKPAGGQGKRASSRVPLGKHCSLDYVGAFLAGGGFKGRSRLRLGELVDTLAGQPDGQQAALAGPPSDDVAPARQRVVEDYEPGAHPVETVNGRPVLADMVDAITDFMAEHQSVLDAPSALATDPSGRLLVADPPAHAVHVLDFRGKTSFRIQGGKDRRLQMPVAVAADTQGSIYVSDSERGMILVYDHLGRFRHYLGKIKGEAFFERPEGVAVDSRAAWIYVADTARNSVSILDLRGTVLKTLGGKARAAGAVVFHKPTSLFLAGGQLFVLDSYGSRVQVLDEHGTLLRQVSTPNDNASPPDHPGLAVDSAGNFYLSDEMKSIVRVFNPAGQLLNSFGQSGSRIGEFSRPLGVWADSADRIYVADSRNHRVQVFQLRGSGRPSACQ